MVDSDASRYVHYFTVCGLDLNFGLEPDEAGGGLEGGLPQEQRWSGRRPPASHAVMTRSEIFHTFPCTVFKKIIMAL